MAAQASDRTRRNAPPATKLAHRDTEFRRRVQRLQRTDISFICSPDFAAEDVGQDHVVDAALFDADEQKKVPADLPTHLRRMCETDLLTHAQETALFREMNHLKFRANVLRSRLDPNHLDLPIADEIESLLNRAEAIRNHIIKANMRLVVSISKKFVTPTQPFDELLSDGTITLMQAVEKFDYTRGFRFSTYAYRSIVRNTYRSVTETRSEQSRFVRDAEQWAFEQAEDNVSSSISDQVWDNLRSLAASMLNELDRRERFIIRSRYALGVHRKVRTLQSLADKLGISKERVRQLEQRALLKLNTMAADLEPDELFGAAMV